MAVTTQAMLDLLGSLQEALAPEDLTALGFSQELMLLAPQKLKTPLDPPPLILPEADAHSTDPVSIQKDLEDDLDSFEIVDRFHKDASEKITKTPNNALREALFCSNSLSRLRALLDQGIDINTPDEWGTKLLANALMNKKADTVSFVLQSPTYSLDAIDLEELEELLKEAKPSSQESSQNAEVTDLIKSFTDSISPEQLLAGKQVLQRLKANATQTDPATGFARYQEKYQETEAFFDRLLLKSDTLANAVRKNDSTETLSALLALPGANVNAPDSGGTKLLGNAILNKKPEAVRFILSFNGSPYQIDSVDLEELFDLFDEADSEKRTQTLESFTNGVTASPIHTEACLALIPQLKPEPPNDCGKYDALEAELRLPAANQQLHEAKAQLRQEEEIIQLIKTNSESVKTQTTPETPAPPTVEQSDLSDPQTKRLQAAELRRQALERALAAAHQQIEDLQTKLDKEIARRRKAEAAMQAASYPAAIRARFAR